MKVWILFLFFLVFIKENAKSFPLQEHQHSLDADSEEWSSSDEYDGGTQNDYRTDDEEDHDANVDKAGNVEIDFKDMTHNPITELVKYEDRPSFKELTKIPFDLIKKPKKVGNIELDVNLEEVVPKSDDNEDYHLHSDIKKITGVPVKIIPSPHKIGKIDFGIQVEEMNPNEDNHKHRKKQNCYKHEDDDYVEEEDKDKDEEIEKSMTKTPIDVVKNTAKVGEMELQVEVREEVPEKQDDIEDELEKEVKVFTHVPVKMADKPKSIGDIELDFAIQQMEKKPIDDMGKTQDEYWTDEDYYEDEEPEYEETTKSDDLEIDDNEEEYEGPDEKVDKLHKEIFSKNPSEVIKRPHKMGSIEFDVEVHETNSKTKDSSDDFYEDDPEESNKKVFTKVPVKVVPEPHKTGEIEFHIDVQEQNQKTKSSIIKESSEYYDDFETGEQHVETTESYQKWHRLITNGQVQINPKKNKHKKLGEIEMEVEVEEKVPRPEEIVTKQGQIVVTKVPVKIIPHPEKVGHIQFDFMPQEGSRKSKGKTTRKPSSEDDLEGDSKDDSENDETIEMEKMSLFDVSAETTKRSKQIGDIELDVEVEEMTSKEYVDNDNDHNDNEEQEKVVTKVPVMLMKKSTKLGEMEFDVKVEQLKKRRKDPEPKLQDETESDVDEETGIHFPVDAIEAHKSGMTEADVDVQNIELQHDQHLRRRHGDSLNKRRLHSGHKTVTKIPYKIMPHHKSIDSHHKEVTHDIKEHGEKQIHYGAVRKQGRRVTEPDTSLRSHGKWVPAFIRRFAKIKTASTSHPWYFFYMPPQAQKQRRWHASHQMIRDQNLRNPSKK